MKRNVTTKKHITHEGKLKAYDNINPDNIHQPEEAFSNEMQNGKIELAKDYKIKEVSLELNLTQHRLSLTNEQKKLEDIKEQDQITKKRRVWSKEEDKTLMNLVDVYGMSSWKKISEKMKVSSKNSQRTRKQCRDRYYNALYLSKKEKGTFSLEQEVKVFELVELYGNRWAKISRKIRGISENQVKNFFYSELRKEIRRIYKKFIKGQKFTEKTKVSIQFLQNLLHDKGISHNEILNPNIRNMLSHLNSKKAEINFLDESPIMYEVPTNVTQEQKRIKTNISLDESLQVFIFDLYICSVKKMKNILL